MFDKLEAIERRFVEIEETLMQPSTSGSEIVKLGKERSEIEPLVQVYRRYKKTASDLNNAKELLNSEEDAEMRDMAKEEIGELTREEEELKKRTHHSYAPF